MNPYRRFWHWYLGTRPGWWWARTFNSSVGPGIDRTLYALSMGRLTTVSGIVPVAILTTTGRRSGRGRSTPVAYLRRDEDVVVVAGNAGSRAHPHWYRNLVASPAVVVSIGGQARTCIARVAGAEERDELWPLLAAASPIYERCREEAEGRELPVVVLTPDRF